MRAQCTHTQGSKNQIYLFSFYILITITKALQRFTSILWLVCCIWCFCMQSLGNKWTERVLPL